MTGFKLFETWTAPEVARLHELAGQGASIAVIALALERAEWDVRRELASQGRPVADHGATCSQ